MLDLLENEIKVPVNSGAWLIPRFGIDSTAEVILVGMPKSPRELPLIPVNPAKSRRNDKF